MKMKAYPSFDAYYADQAPENQAVIKVLRAFVKKSAPKLEESVKWGNGCWLLDGSPVCYVYAGRGYTQFGFFNGVALKDPQKLLGGEGAYLRHIKIHDKTQIQPEAYAALLKQATPARIPKKKK